MKINIKKTALTEPTLAKTACLFTAADRKRLRPLLSKDSFDQLMRLEEHDPFPRVLIDSDGEETEVDCLNPICIQSWHDDSVEYIYQIGKYVFAYDDDETFTTYYMNHVTQIVDINYPYETGEFETRCAGFDINPVLRTARRDYDGACSVWIETHYTDLQSAGSDVSHWAYDDCERRVAQFESYTAARKWINKDKKAHHFRPDIVYPGGYYMYCRNEVAPRTYKICEANHNL